MDSSLIVLYETPANRRELFTKFFSSAKEPFPLLEHPQIVSFHYDAARYAVNPDQGMLTQYDGLIGSLGGQNPDIFVVSASLLRTVPPPSRTDETDGEQPEDDNVWTLMANEAANSIVMVVHGKRHPDLVATINHNVRIAAEPSGTSDQVKIYHLFGKDDTGTSLPVAKLITDLMNDVIVTHPDGIVRQRFGGAPDPDTNLNMTAIPDPEPVVTAPVEPNRNGKIVAVVSGKGGEQKSTVSVNLATMIGRSVNMTRTAQGHDLLKVALLSLDISHDSIRSKCGAMRGNVGLHDLVLAGISPHNVRNTAVWKDEMMVWVFPGYTDGIYGDNVLTLDVVEQLLDELRRQFDIIVLDMPIDIQDQRTRVGLQHADLVYYLSKGESTSLQEMSKWIIAATTPDMYTGEAVVPKEKIGVVMVDMVLDYRKTNLDQNVLNKAMHGTSLRAKLPALPREDVKLFDNSNSVYEMLDVSRDTPLMKKGFGVKPFLPYHAYFDGLFSMAKDVVGPRIAEEMTKEIFYPGDKYVA